MPLPFNLFEKIGMSALNMGPGPMADILGVLAFKALVAAIRLDVFEIIGRGRVRIGELARSTGADPAGLTFLVNLLDSLGYLKQSRGCISNTAMTRKWILHDSPCAITDLFASMNDASERWDYLSDSIQGGHPPILGSEWLSGEKSRWARYHRGLRSAAHLIAPGLVKSIRIPGNARSMLDCGGGHGYYCIELCKRHPGLRATILDWEPAGPVALQNISEAGLGDRLTFRAGDFLVDDIGSGYDVLLLFNVIRIFNQQELLSFLEKVRRALSPGGTVAIMDHMGYMPGSRFMRANTMSILLEIYNSTTGRIHRAGDVSRALADAGFTRIRKKDLPRTPGLTLLQARCRS